MKLGLIGAGNMASALARGLDEPVLVSDPLADRAEALARAVGGRALQSNTEVAEEAEVVVLCHKPAQLAEVAKEIAGSARVLVTILAATTTAQVEQAYPDLPVYRFIPNIPVGVRRGVLCYAPGRLAGQGPEQEILELFGRAGLVIPLEEPLLEPAMALMSCGPAFLALVCEAFSEAGVKHGLIREQAVRMIVETMAGTAAYLSEHELDLAALRGVVATPGGVTERGLATLERGGLRELCDAAVDTVLEATRR
jgi:pyrroline-5-carboxylate reductase